MKLFKKSYILIFPLLISVTPQWSSKGNCQEQQWISIGPEGGEVTSLVQAPSDSSIFYAAVWGNPVKFYKSEDSGNSWLEMGRLADAYFLAFAVDPVNSAIIYATNYGFIYKSENSGLTWEKITLPANLSASSIVINPANPNILYSGGQATTGGSIIYKSETAGESWSMIYYSSQNSWISSIAIDQTNPNILYAAGAEVKFDYTITGVILKTDNAGATWTPTGPEINRDFQHIIIDPSNPDFILFTTESYIFRSDNAGQDWQRNEGDACGNVLAIDPDDSNIIYAGYENEIYKSTDGGENWDTHATGLYGGACCQIIAENDFLILSNHAGVFKSTTGGTEWYTSNSGLVAGKATVVRVAQSSPSTAYIAIEGDGLYKKNDSSTKNNSAATPLWSRLTQFDVCDRIADIEIDKSNMDILYAYTGGT